MTEFINLTPHAINIVGSDEKIVKTIEPSGRIARVKVESKIVGQVNGINIVKSTFGNVEGITREEIVDSQNTAFIVSRMVKERINQEWKYNNFMVVIPDDIVRDKDGKIIGCRRFSI